MFCTITVTRSCEQCLSSQVQSRDSFAYCCRLAHRLTVFFWNTIDASRGSVLYTSAVVKKNIFDILQPRSRSVFWIVLKLTNKRNCTSVIKATEYLCKLPFRNIKSEIRFRESFRLS